MLPEQENLIYIGRGVKLRWEKANGLQQLRE